VEYASETIERLVNAISRLPGIGKKSAQRAALYLLQEPREESEKLARAILDVKDKVGFCSICYNLTEADPCSICRDFKRDHQTICVVEEPKDLMAIERTHGYRGVYHVLGGVLSPLDGIGEDQLNVQALLARLDSGVSEVIIATNPTVEGEMTAAHLAKMIKEKGIKASRIARGVPFGGSLEFNDSVTVAKAMEGRVEISS